MLVLPSSPQHHDEQSRRTKVSSHATNTSSRYCTVHQYMCYNNYKRCSTKCCFLFDGVHHCSNALVEVNASSFIPPQCSALFMSAVQSVVGSSWYIQFITKLVPALFIQLIAHLPATELLHRDCILGSG